ncbi:NAD(P)-dependent oxidoreductase [Skermanella mucosa]|uniref:NAD-dependent epimerase/dehydratase family protein n=1 Tax=Skermanella mucosa TaxID=1789672 RepID=UPI00192C9024|nr:NAD(P)-dependent oxidoreductase [Skermanella mucosa]UEM18897.1 NAD(P)-dependent oxidoreductase [Skermanella mucosa]
MSGRRILVTGGTGFIGRALVGRLVRDGHEVTCLVRGGGPTPAGAHALEIAALDEAGLHAVPVEGPFDTLFHLAAYGVRPEQRDASAMAWTNVAGTVALTAIAKRWSVAGIVYAGSCSEYAEPTEHRPVGEGDALTSTALYGASKAAGGMIGRAMAETLGIGFSWMRLFGTYGPGEADYRLIPYLIGRLGRGEEVDLTPGAQARDFLHVDDVVEGLVAAAEITRPGRTDVFNLCSGQPVTVGQVAEKVADALGRPRALLRFGARPYRHDELMWLVGDGTRFREATGWTPGIGLDDGIASMVSALAERRSP